ncbi:hypothetical protein ACHAPG_009242 [Botrytis cinerea]
MSSTLAEKDEPLENQSTSGLDESNDVGKTSKSGEDRDQERESKSTQDFQEASESVQDNETTISTSTEQNTTIDVIESKAKEATGIGENEDSRSNGHEDDYPKTADDEIRDLKRRILDLETKFNATSREIIRSKPDHDEWSDDTDEEEKISKDGIELTKYTKYTKYTKHTNPREKTKTTTCISPSERERIRSRSRARSFSEYESDTQEATQKTVHVIPKLNPVEWKNFKTIPSPLDDIYAIDVLVGEPNFAFETYQYETWKRMRVNKGGSLRAIDYSDQRTTFQPSTKTLVAGQAALPERIRINSKYIITILSKIYKNDFSNHRNDPVLLFRPFKALSFYEEEIRTQHTALNAKLGKKTTIGGDPEPKDLDSEAEFNELSCLIEFIDHYIKNKQKYLARSSLQKVVFSDIWHLFKPGDEVMEGKLLQAYRVISVDTKKHRFAISRWRTGLRMTKDYGLVTVHCVCIDFDGKLLGPVSKHFRIHEYEGEQNVTSLPVYPLRFSKETNREGLIARGKLFLETAGVKYMHCAGLTLDTRDEVDSQVVIDFEEALFQNQSWVPFIERLVDAALDPEVKNEKEDGCDSICCGSEICHNDSYVDHNRIESFLENQRSAVSWKHSSLTIVPKSLQEARGDNLPSQDEFLIMSHRVFGFILRSRKWAKLNLGDITEVRRVDDKNGFDQLVLPKGHKDMVKCLIRQHFKEKELELADKDEMDIVRGKGKGLIMLLHGAPGVGKTSTAECVADSFQKPLFQITCGDLGSEAAEVEAALETTFSLAHRWGCILLIDEADIFLAERTRHDFLRNAFVAVFLRVLDYYAGILFLTTNRVGAFDEAFTSRIHVSLYYPQLSWNSTLEIFKMNMQRVKDRFVKRNRDFKIDEAGIGAFAKSYYEENREGRWNGRQIRNAFQTALALAEYDAQGYGDAVSLTENINTQVILNGDHFETVSEAYLGFVHYLKEVNHGAGVAKRALDRSNRDDEFGEPRSASWSRLEAQRGGISPTPLGTSTPRHLPDHNFQNDRRQQSDRMVPSGVPISNYEQSYHGNHYQDPGLNPNFLNSGDRQQPQPMGPTRGNNFPQNTYSFREDPNDMRDLGRNYTTSSERGIRKTQHPSQGSQGWSTSERMERNDSSNYANYPLGPNMFGMERRGVYTEDRYDNQSGIPSRGVEEQRTNARGFHNPISQG